MAQPLRVVVGPLASADDDIVSLSQKVAAATYLVVNGAGAAGTFLATSVAAAQAVGSATNLTLNGTTVNSLSGAAVAYLPSLSRVYITSAGDDSGITFTVYGTIFSLTGPAAVTETVTGANASVVSTIKKFQTVTRVAASAAAAGNVSVGHSGVSTVDLQRRIIVTSAGDDTGITFTLSGTDANGSTISEVITGVNNAAASSVLSYKTVTSILTSAAVATTVKVGTNTVADSAWLRFDDFAGNSQVAIQCTVSGTANYTVSQTLEDPNFVTNTVNPNTYTWTPAQITWVNHPDAALVAASTTQQGNYAYVPVFSRVTLNSGTGTVTSTFRQAYLA